MVEVIQALATDHASPLGGGAPLIHIHHIERSVFGNGIALKVYGEIKIASNERVLAKELKLKTIQTLNLTPELPLHNGLGYMAQKYVHHKGEFGNYASIDIYDDASTDQTAGNGPVDGSIWLDFIAAGE